jgi:murein DD-endopeptidase MepM/ murein hydrolase activator NlpD
MKRFWILTPVFLFLVFPSICRALQISLPDTSYQGDTIIGKVDPPAAVYVNGKLYPVSDRGYFVIGIPRLKKKDISVWSKTGRQKVSKTIRVLAYPWQIQRIDGLPDTYVNLSPENIKRIRNDNQKVQSARLAMANLVPLFLNKGFIAPVKGPITGVFGSQRILNGEPRSPHQGVDFAAPLNTPVLCPADGIVRLAAWNMYLMGNILMIDHGLGVQSIFMHLNHIFVKEGDVVKQGTVIGRVGKTGRATGPHLHWGVSVGTIPVDPARLLNRQARALSP